MEENLNLDSILSSEDVENLFADGTQETPPENNGDSDGNPQDNKENNTDTTEVNVDTLFTGKPESVGSEEDNQEKETEDTTSEKGGTSPKTNFYSSIASALKDEGILPDLDDEVVNNVKSPEDFAEAIEKQIQSKFDERQKRIDAALNANVEPDEIRQYEGTLNYLDSIKDEHVSDESEKGEELRKRLIFQDFINRGYSKERASREVNSISAPPPMVLPGCAVVSSYTVKASASGENTAAYSLILRNASAASSAVISSAMNLLYSFISTEASFPSDFTENNSIAAITAETINCTVITTEK